MTVANPGLLEASLAGGCFWCLEAVFEAVLGVDSVVSGYMGGPNENPTYLEVCSGRSGHAEMVRLLYDPTMVSFATLLEIFFAIHDPTSLDRQGNDRGTQYRSAIFFHDAEQQAIALQVIAHLQTTLPATIVTEVVPVAPFYAAEEEHQHYFARHRDAAYCSLVVAPKVSKFEQHFPCWVRAS